MPADRISLESYAYNPLRRGSSESKTKKPVPQTVNAEEGEIAVETDATAWADGRKAEEVYYPQKREERESFKIKGKRVPKHHWDVYDYILGIPTGKVTTYKEVSLAVGGSPRSVGNALRNNPFMPFIPCHRVIASDLTLGGYFGEWGKTHKTGTKYHQKLDILAQEGVKFTAQGKLASAPQAIWQPSSSE
ncbi:6-O-methylguanine DNA methyltransferase, DNA binding domain containing protein [Amanita muscaria]